MEITMTENENPKGAILQRDKETYAIDWQNERYSIGTIVEWNFHDNISVEYGMLFSEISNYQFLSHEFGLGFRRTLLNTLGIRLDNIITAYNQHYNSELVRKEYGGDDTDYLFYTKNGSRVYFGNVLSLTLNTLPELLGVNYFLSIEYGYNKYFFSGNDSFGSTLGFYKNI
jgi:hypothetical protein